MPGPWRKAKRGGNRTANTGTVLTAESRVLTAESQMGGFQFVPSHMNGAWRGKYGATGGVRAAGWRHDPGCVVHTEVFFCVGKKSAT